MLKSENFLHKQIVKILTWKNEFSNSEAEAAAIHALRFKRENPKSCTMLIISEAKRHAIKICSSAAPLIECRGAVRITAPKWRP